MYRNTDIVDGLKGLVGWRQHRDPNTLVLEDDLIQSSSGMRFQDIHPLVTLDNILSVSPTFNDMSEFNAWLRQKTEASISKVIRTFWDSKMSQDHARNIISHKTLYNNTVRLDDLEENKNKLVGIEITPIRANGVTTRIDKIGVQRVGTGPLTLYLMHSSRRHPVKVFTLNETNGSGFEDLLPNEPLYLPYQSDTIGAGGSWYLVYKQSELSDSQAVNSIKDWSKSPNDAQGRGAINDGNTWSPYIEVHPFTNAEPQGDMELWDIRDNQYGYISNYGINIQYTVMTDITETLLQQKEIFQTCIALQVAKDMINEFAYNPSFKVNRTSSNFTRNELLYELKGNDQGRKTGLEYQFEKALKNIELDVTNLSRMCFKSPKKGIRIRTV